MTNTIYSQLVFAQRNRVSDLTVWSTDSTFTLGQIIEVDPASNRLVASLREDRARHINLRLDTITGLSYSESLSVDLSVSAASGVIEIVAEVVERPDLSGLPAGLSTLLFHPDVDLFLVENEILGLCLSWDGEVVPVGNDSNLPELLSAGRKLYLVSPSEEFVRDAEKVGALANDAEKAGSSVLLICRPPLLAHLPVSRHIEFFDGLRWTNLRVGGTENKD